MGAGTYSASGGNQEEQFITRAGDLRPHEERPDKKCRRKASGTKKRADANPQECLRG